jgi:hypothetical protein
MNVSDVGMVERDENSGLPLKPCQPFRIAREHLRKNLDRHVEVELCVPCSIHLAYAALAEQGKDFVMTEFIARKAAYVGFSSA